jgi:hypothetical protein
LRLSRPWGRRRAGIDQSPAVVVVRPGGAAQRLRIASGDGWRPITPLAMTSAAVAETAGAAIEVP